MKQKLNIIKNVELKFRFGIFPYLKYEYQEIEIDVMDWMKFMMQEETEKMNANYARALKELQNLKSHG